MLIRSVSRNGRVIERKGERRAVKVAAGKDVAVVGKNERVIGRRAGFDCQNLLAMPERAADRAVNLRHAAQTIGILDSRIVCADANRGFRCPRKSARRWRATACWPGCGRAS